MLYRLIGEIFITHFYSVQRLPACGTMIAKNYALKRHRAEFAVVTKDTAWTPMESLASI